MTIDPEMLMAYADGELDPLAAKRVERAIATNPALAKNVAQHRALRARINGEFATLLDEPIPDRLTAPLKSNVVVLPTKRPQPIIARWRGGMALAASLALGLSIGLAVQRGPVTARSNGLYASGQLASALNAQPSGVDGAIKVAVSFRDKGGKFCRVFTSAVTDGIACRDSSGWALRQTNTGVEAARGAYRQAGSADAELMAAAQDMMAGDPLDRTDEAGAMSTDWR